jgi:hypothetical protein
LQSFSGASCRSPPELRSAELSQSSTALRRGLVAWA